MKVRSAPDFRCLSAVNRDDKYVTTATDSPLVLCDAAVRYTGVIR